MKQIHEAVQALESDMILAAILDFVKEAEKRNAKEIYRANSLGPICILQIFRKIPSRDGWLYYQILMGQNEQNRNIR